MLTQEQRTDLRNRVLAGERLTPELSKLVVETLRGNRTRASELAAASGKKTTRKKGLTDEQLDADLDDFLGIGNKADTPEGSSV